MPQPSVDASGCSLDQLSDADHDAPYDDLFKRKRMKGWWPSYEVNEEGVRELNVSTLHTPSEYYILPVHSCMSICTVNYYTDRSGNIIATQICLAHTCKAIVLSVLRL